MKRCPECGREYDATMMFCLDDGAELLYGPASMDEPQTAIMPEPPASAGGQFSEARTRAHIHATEAEAQYHVGEVSERPGLFAHRAAKALMAALAISVFVLGGLFGYRYITQAKQIESIAVMPFVNESGNEDVEYLSDGMTETLINSLTEIPDLSVKARSSVFYYKGKNASAKQIGRELNVDAVLLGRVTQRGDDLNLSLELVDAATENLLWSDRYDRKRSDLVTIQNQIAREVSTRLKSKLSGEQQSKVADTGTTNAEAYQAYLKGRYYWNRRTEENIKKAIEQFKIAADQDPNYALAYSGLADSYGVLPSYSGGRSGDALPQAKFFAEKALSIDPTLGETHASLGLVNSALWNRSEAEKNYRRAIELDPNYATAYQWYSVLLKEHRKYDEALKMVLRARELDPLSSVIGVNLALMYQQLDRHEESIDICKKVIELDPNYAGAHFHMGMSYLKLGRTDEAIATIEKAAELSGRLSGAMARLGYVYAAAGKRNEAFSIIKGLEEDYANKKTSGQSLAEVYAGLGDKDKALEWLEKDFEDKNWALPHIGVSIVFESLRDDPRFMDLLSRMNMPA